MMGKVSNIQKFSVHDGYGIRTVVFLLGCSMECKWCQNPETIKSAATVMLNTSNCIGCGVCLEICESNACTRNSDGTYSIDRDKCENCFRCVEECFSEARRLSGKLISADEVFNEVTKDAVFFKHTQGGLTISGGEPLLQAEFCRQLLLKCQEHEIHTAIETAGNVPWSCFERIVDVTDLFLYDLKFYSSDLHQRWTGCKNHLIKNNLEKLAETGKEIIIRVPLIPDLNDGTEFFKLVDYVNRIDEIVEIHILPFHQLGSSKYEQTGLQYLMTDWSEENKERIEYCKAYAESQGFRVSIGGTGFNAKIPVKEE